MKWVRRYPSRDVTCAWNRTFKRCSGRVQSLGRVDVLVNNAGSELNRAFDETTEEEWDRVLDTDLKGPWLMCKHIVPGMVKAGSGSVINISSLNGLVGFPLSTAYGGAKGGLVVFTRDLAIELANTGVRVTASAPGSSTPG